MKKNINNKKIFKQAGFTLVELIAVIIILCITVSIVIVKVDNNVKDVSEFGDKMQIENIESAAYIYAEENRDNLNNLSISKVQTITIATLIESGLLASKDVKDINTNNLVLIAEINGILKIKYIVINKNVIFLNGSKEISIYKDDMYTEMGAYVAVPGTGLIKLDDTNISSKVNTSVLGEYEVTYSYTDTESVVRKVFIID